MRDACRYVSNVHSTAAPPSRPAHSQQPTHTDTHPLAARGAYTQARSDSPNASRSDTAPKRYTTELRAGGCPKPTGRRPTDPQPTIATARASPVESNALNGPTRLTATTPRRVRTGSSQLNLRSDGQRLRPSAPTARRCSRWLTRRSAPFDFDATLDFDLNLAPLPFRRQQPSIGVEPTPNPLPRIAMPYHSNCHFDGPSHKLLSRRSTAIVAVQLTHQHRTLHLLRQLRFDVWESTRLRERERRWWWSEDNFGTQVPIGRRS